MTLVEFIAPLKSARHRDRILATMYYKQHTENAQGLFAYDIRQALKSARAPNWSKVNVTDVLIKSGHLVDRNETDGGSFVWKLTGSGEDYVREVLGIPNPKADIEHDVDTLAALVAQIRDDETRGYVEESVTCLRNGALRASVVFLWSGAIKTIQLRMLAVAQAQVNAAIHKHDPQARNVTRPDHFAYVKDKISILAAMDLGLLDKSEKDTLIEALDLRNRSGHPGKYKPGVKKVSSFIEDVISIVFS